MVRTTPLVCLFITVTAVLLAGVAVFGISIGSFTYAERLLYDYCPLYSVMVQHFVINSLLKSTFYLCTLSI